MQPTLASLGHVLLAFHQHFSLSSNVPQSAQHLLVAVHEAKALVLNSRLSTELSHQELQSPQIVSRDPGK